MHCQYPFLTPNVAAFWREQEQEQWLLSDAVEDKFALNLLHLFWRLQESYDPGKLKLSCSSVNRFILTNFDSAKTERIWYCKYNANKAHIPKYVSSSLTIFVFFFLSVCSKLWCDLGYVRALFYKLLTSARQLVRAFRFITSRANLSREPLKLVEIYLYKETYPVSVTKFLRRDIFNSNFISWLK